jgi:hypothetical protein
MQELLNVKAAGTYSDHSAFKRIKKKEMYPSVLDRLVSNVGVHYRFLTLISSML